MPSKRENLPGLLALALVCAQSFAQLTVPAFADETSLQAENASADSSAPRPDTPTEQKTTTLNGSVERRDKAHDANLQAEAGTNGLYNVALQKLSANKHLTAEEFRSLGIGIIGAELYRPYLQKEARVEKLYAGCPAALAGMQLGDVVIVQDADAQNAQVKDLTRPSWMFTAGLEGQKVDYTVDRNGEQLNFHLVRMNVEDVPDPKIRRNYEQMIERLGGSQGSVMIPKPKD